MSENDPKPPRPRSTEDFRPDSGQNRSSNMWRLIIFSLLIAAGVQIIWSSQASDEVYANKTSYSSFRQLLAEDKVSEIRATGDKLEFKAVSGNQNKKKSFVTYLPAFGDKKLLDLIEEKGVPLKTRPEPEPSPLGGIVAFVLPWLLIFGLGYYALRKMSKRGSGMMGMGKSRAKLYERTDEKTGFDDVAGAENVKNELKEVVDYLTSPKRFKEAGAKPPKGVLLVGPPGTGKTLMARAAAGESGVPFFSITGSDFMEMFVGVGASRVRDLFKDARKHSPSIIFIDELDSIGRRRGAGLGGGHDEREQTLNQLLSEMDGFEPHEEVIVIAATNRPDILDQALLRPGRFNRRITVDLPKQKSRRAILDVHSRNKKLEEDVNLDDIARSTPGFSGADLENLLNEGALLAGREGRTHLCAADLEQARDKIILGLEREGVALSEREKQLVAYHEAGHAIVAARAEHADPIHKVSIVPREKTMGVTQLVIIKDMYVYPREYLIDKITVMMGGRAAEQLVFETATTGAYNDLTQATRLARKMVLSWGMGEALGHVAFEEPEEHVFLGSEISNQRQYSEQTAREIDEEIRDIAREAYLRAEKTLSEESSSLDEIAAELEEHEEITGAEVLKILEKNQGKRALPRAAGAE